MAKDEPAPETPGDGISEGDFKALLATLSASERGRAFLAEFARRQRAAETDRVVAALERLDAKIAHMDAQLAAQQQPHAAEPAQPSPTAVDQPATNDKPADKPASVETPPVRLTVVAPRAAPQAATAATPVSVLASRPAPTQPTATVIPEVTWQEATRQVATWQEASGQAPDALLADDRIKITIADDEPEIALADDQPEAAAVEAPSQTAIAEEAPEPAVAVAAALPNMPPPQDVAESVEITTAVEARVALPREQPATLSDAPEPVAAEPVATLEEKAAVNSALEQVASLAHDALSLAHVALEHTALPPAEAPQQQQPPEPAALPRGLIDQPPPSPDHPLAQLMALSDEERIALFS